MARKYNVEGTNDYLIFGLALLAFAVWSAVDGWFPPPKVLERHPREAQIKFEIPGRVESIPVKPGQDVTTNTVVATLRKKEMESLHQQWIFHRQDAMDSMNRARNSSSEADRTVASNRWLEADARVREIGDAIPKTQAASSVNGEVVRIYKAVGDEIQPSEPVVGVFPDEHAKFYSFNRIAAVGCAIAALISFLVHMRVK